MRKRTPLHERVLAKTNETVDGCWEYCGYRMKNGYGTISLPHGSGTKLTHRVVYEALIGPIPIGLELDHLCRNRACVNPAHLESVDRHTNIMRGMGPPETRRRAAERDTCRRGHPYDDPSTYSGYRYCRPCMAAAARERRRRRKATA